MENSIVYSILLSSISISEIGDENKHKWFKWKHVLMKETLQKQTTFVTEFVFVSDFFFCQKQKFLFYYRNNFVSETLKKLAPSFQSIFDLNWEQKHEKKTNLKTANKIRQNFDVDGYFLDDVHMFSTPSKRLFIMCRIEEGSNCLLNINIVLMILH